MGWSSKTTRLQLLDDHRGQTDICLPAQPALGEFLVVDAMIESVKHVVGDELHEDATQLFRHLLVDEALGFEDPEEAAVR